ncbi:FAD-dependent oxidoreductase [Nakamurella antarctica]|uniref:FAD-dependent oxidoreductase n=1 Tax=Nakamurella antarctica TaxID=1902245 RepID=A0A3G9A066_9ACTN|nr:FAD-dependent oxidoreductase [Nakamurella antarctica]
MEKARPRVAVIGAGVAGLTAAYLLQRANDVTLYEQDSRLGGHAHTHDLVDGSGDAVSVDSGFIVHNNRTYPHLLRLFAELGVATQESEMSMSVSCAGCGLEYAGARGISGLFAYPGIVGNTRYLRMLLEVKTFHRQAHKVLAGTGRDITLGEFLAAGNFSTYFTQHFILPVVACVWSCGHESARQYPARYLFRFLDHHGLLSVTGSPAWKTVTGGSRTYVELAVKNLTAAHTSARVKAVSRVTDGVEIRTEAGDVAVFESAVIATHPHQALAMLAAPTVAETEVLGAIEYTPSTTVLHTDASILPQHPKARASWNYRMDSCAGGDDKVHVTYDMTRLQRLDSQTPYLVTLNSDELMTAESKIATMHYEHPLYTPSSVAAQGRLPELSRDGLVFAGAYHGWGFHEDGCASGVRAAEALGSAW